MGKVKKFRKRRVHREEAKYRRLFGEIGSKFKSRRPGARRGDRKLREDFRLKIQERFIFLHGDWQCPLRRGTRHLALGEPVIPPLKAVGYNIEKNGALRI